ncbi:hypothetical protein CG740_23055 [Streptomyces sp. CB01201]|uniref:hypothetical protein n=1 Tax=Streptomyces sp. CB01201 TaxID=2020324 RepID=UPI000C27412D|nr:hypothetical protein [Streptomyces sp. CB01201]PJN00787.1 hypothetical protein CG740_23055 [Streptomyces sp. CB01201]
MGRIVPVPVNEAPGNYDTAALFNAQVRDLNNFALGPPVFLGYATTAQSIAGSNAMVALNLDTETLDADGGHSTVTNTSRYTPTVAGLYLVFGSVGWPNTVTGDRRLQIGLNGGGVIGSGASFDPSNAVTSGMQTSAFVTCNGSTDYIEVMAAQASGGAMNTSAGASIFTASMRVLWISR